MLMSSPRLFCPAFRLGTHLDSFVTSSQGSSRKRKRGEVDPSEVGATYHEGGRNEGKPSFKRESLTPTSTILGPVTTACAREDQLHTQASLRRHEGLGNHGLIREAETSDDSNSSGSESGTSDTTSASLTLPSLSSRPSPRRRPVSGPPRSDGPRQQHLAAVLAILHRCLLQGDYLRASRAWALLLRSEMNGRPMDVRYKERWGIGAEILLQRSILQRRDHLRGDSGSIVEDYDEMSTKYTKLTYSGSLRPVQDYYERLIVQYPHRKGSKIAVGPLEFYPVLFGLRMFSEQHSHGDLFRSFQENCPDDENNMKEKTSPENGSTSPRNPDSEFLQINKLLESSVTRGKEIANQLDELLSSPPYSDDFKLQNLRTMIGLWIEDLLASPYFEKALVAGNR